MGRKLSIIKKGYDVLRIIEMGNGEFKITNETGIKDFNVYAQELFLKPKYINFDKSQEWEISYHSSTDKEPAKIHLKKRKNNEYTTLPLTNLIDPDTNTEIPIPLFKVIIPDVALSKEYNYDVNGDKEHVVIDIEDNNSIEIFLTSNLFVKNKHYSDKWKNMIDILISTDIRYYASKLNDYVYMNDFYREMNNPDVTGSMNRLVCRGASITNNIGIMVSTTNILDLNTNKLVFLFIDNSEYLTFLANMKFIDPNTNQIMKLYKYDLKDNSYFNNEETKKWEMIINQKEKETNKLLKKYCSRITQQAENKKQVDKEIKELMFKCAEFISNINSIKLNILEKYNLLTQNEIDNAKQDLISDINFDLSKLCNIDLNELSNIDWWFINALFDKQSEVTLLLCKYLNIKEPIIFKYTLQSKKYNDNNDDSKQFKIISSENLKFDYIRLLYNSKYDIEPFRGILNTFLDNKKENNILISKHLQTEEEYMMYGVSERIKLENKFDIYDEGLYRIGSKKFQEKIKENNGFLEEIYNLIIKHMKENPTIYD